MSARKRRQARQIARLVRMDAQAHRMAHGWILAGRFVQRHEGGRRVLFSAMALGRALRRRGLMECALVALEKAHSGAQ